MARDAFKDPAGLLQEGNWWEWPIGHETEDPEVSTTNLERSSVTTGVGFVRQQGAPSPTVKKLHGWIVDPLQKALMEEFYNACAGLDAKGARTVFYQDITGAQYEVFITSWEPVRKVGRAGGTGLNYVWQYSITMEVISTL